MATLAEIRDAVVSKANALAASEGVADTVTNAGTTLTEIRADIDAAIALVFGIEQARSVVSAAKAKYKELL